MNNNIYKINKNQSEQLDNNYNKKIILKKFLTKSEKCLMRNFWTRSEYECKTKTSFKNKRKEYSLNKHWYDFMENNK